MNGIDPFQNLKLDHTSKPDVRPSSATFPLDELEDPTPQFKVQLAPYDHVMLVRQNHKPVII